MRFRAVSVVQTLGQFFAVAIPARLLRQIVFLDPTRISSVDKNQFFYRLLGSQRDASGSRARSIAKYINSVESAFPNSVILSANYNDKGLPIEDQEKRWRIEEDECGPYLVVPTNAAMASVIDGQHRLLGFDHAEDARKDMELLCSVYIDLPVAYQAYLFATININQRKVDKSLAYEQFGYNLDEEPQESWAPDKLAVFFTRKLNLNPESPMYQRIKIAPLDADLVFPPVSDGHWQVSTACVVEGLLSLFSSKPQSDRDLLHTKSLSARHRNILPQDNSPLRDYYLACDDAKLWSLIEVYLLLVKKTLWDKATSSSYIRKTIGVQALFDVFRVVAQSTNPLNLEKKLTTVIASAREVDFADQFFQASGKGRGRVKNAILYAAGLLGEGEIGFEDISYYRNLAPTPPVSV